MTLMPQGFSEVWVQVSFSSIRVPLQIIRLEINVARREGQQVVVKEVEACNPELGIFMIADLEVLNGSEVALPVSRAGDVRHFGCAIHSVARGHAEAIPVDKCSRLVSFRGIAGQERLKLDVGGAKQFVRRVLESRRSRIGMWRIGKIPAPGT